MSDDLKKEVRKLSKLKQYKDKPNSWLEKKARLNIWKKQVDITSRFSEANEQHLAENAFANYLDNYEFESYSDVQIVSDLVYEEVLKFRLQVELDKLINDKNNKFVPDRMIGSLHDIEDRILSLKAKVGIIKERKSDELSELEELQKRFKIYIPFNRNEFTTVCGSCGKPLLLRRRCGEKNWENLIHPFFSGRFWYNPRAMSLVKNGIISKETYAYIMHTTVSYVEWCLENENKIVEIDGIEKERVQEFIKNNPCLSAPKISEDIKDNK